MNFNEENANDSFASMAARRKAKEMQESQGSPETASPVFSDVSLTKKKVRGSNLETFITQMPADLKINILHNTVATLEIRLT